MLETSAFATLVSEKASTARRSGRFTRVTISSLSRQEPVLGGPGLRRPHPGTQPRLQQRLDEEDGSGHRSNVNIVKRYQRVAVDREEPKSPGYCKYN